MTTSSSAGQCRVVELRQIFPHFVAKLVRGGVALHQLVAFTDQSDVQTPESDLKLLLGQAASTLLGC